MYKRQVSDTIENSNLYYEKFVKKFIEAYNVARENNIFVYNSILNSFFRIRKKFCVGEFCVTPTGRQWVGLRQTAGGVQVP